MVQDQQLTGINAKTPTVNPAARPIGASIPVTKHCSMSVMATGEVTQKGLEQLISYLKLVKESFPEEETEPN